MFTFISTVPPSPTTVWIVISDYLDLGVELVGGSAPGGQRVAAVAEADHRKDLQIRAYN